VGGDRVYPALLVVTADGNQREIVDAVIRPDSIVGTRTDSLAGQRFAIAQGDVARVESRESDAAPVLGAIGGFLLDIVRGFGQLVGSMFRCILLRCSTGP
jgi:hypothetical protein